MQARTWSGPAGESRRRRRGRRGGDGARLQQQGYPSDRRGIS
jgi:hypothetical protein